MKKTVNNKITKKQKAFTLIELIVVITILAILGTIGFIAMQGYSAKTRNSVRITDLKSMEKVLELSSLETGDYPTPTGVEGVDIFTKSYSGANLWIEGRFNQDILNQTGNLDKVPQDPKTDEKYKYSKAINQNEYQIQATLEPDSVAINNAFAAGESTIKILGNYNGVYVIGDDGAYYAVPSLFSNDSVDGFYLNNQEEELSFTIVKLADKKPTEDDPTDNYTTFGDNIKAAYNIADFQNLPVYKELLDISDSAELGEVIVSSGILSSGEGVGLSSANFCTGDLVLANANITNNSSLTEDAVYQNTDSGASCYYECKAGYGGDNCEIQYSCTGALVTANATITNNTDLTADTAYQNTDSGASCYYECKDNYSGTNCETYSLITSSQCTGAGWIWVPDTNDVKIGTQAKTGFCISPRIGDFAGDTTGNGISWNGWGYETSDGNYQGWNSSASLELETVDDGGNPYPQYGQTKNLTHVNDTPTPYACSELGSASGGYIGEDTIAGRMKWLADNKTNLAAMQNIPWIGSMTLKNGHPTPALYIADCIDGVKDLGEDMTYIHNDNSTDEVTYAEYNADVAANTDTADLTNTTYQNRQKYLTAWTQKSGSHLPSAFSYINSGTPGGCTGTNCDNLSDDNAKGEYQMACELYQNISPATTENDFYDAGASSSDDVDNEWIWLSAVGGTDGSDWGRGARLVGRDGCSDQGNGHTGNRNGDKSARFVVRP